jgi:hypothetical protein
MIACPLAILILLNRGTVRQRLTHAGIYLACALAAFSPWLIRNAVNTGNPVFPLAYSVFGADSAAWDDELAERWHEGHLTPDTQLLNVNTFFLAFGRTVAEPRFGLVLWLLAAIGTWRPRDRLTLACWLVLTAQILIWLFATHQYARFAVVMLLPLLLLAARSGASVRNRSVSALLCIVVVAGAAWNLYHIAGLYYYHTRIGREPVHLYGRTDAFTEQGWVGTVNRLGSAADVMLVGEARSYYTRPACEYATVFNRHPLSRVLRETDRPEDILDWLRQRGTTHVFVHFGEIRRLRRTYGFDEKITPELFDSLTKAGLIERESFSSSSNRPPYAVLYEVPQHE